MAGTRIQLKRGTASDWTDANTVLRQGEVGLELDTGKFKWGDGTTAWSDLAYIGGGSFPPDGWSIGPNGELTLKPADGEDITAIRVEMNDDGDGFAGFAFVDRDGKTIVRITDGEADFGDAGGGRAGGTQVFDVNGNSVFYAAGGQPVGITAADGQASPAQQSWWGRLTARLRVFGDNTLILDALAFGTSGNAITIELVDPSANDQALSVSVVDSAITVSLATDGGGAITSTTDDLIAALNGDTDASALVGAGGTGGSSPVIAVAETPLADGRDSQVSWGVAGDGSEFMLALPSAPADEAVSTSARLQWYDDTPGAPKLRIKEKDADGTLAERISAVLTSDGTSFAGVAKPSVGTADAASILAALVTLGLVTDDT